MKPVFKQLLIWLILTPIPFSGQLIAQISIGVKGIASTTGAPMVQKQDLFSRQIKNTFNPGISIYFEIPLNDKLSLQPEVSYRQHRTNYQLHTNYPIIHSSIINYFRMPILLKYKQKGSWIDLVAFGGPSFGYSVGLRAIEYGIFNKTLSLSEYGIRRFDPAFSMGAGIEKTIANKFRTSLDLRFDFGLIDILKSPDNAYFNNGLALEAGILIPLQKSKPQEIPED